MRLFALYFELKIMHSIDFCTVLFVDLYLSVLIVNSQRGFFLFLFFFSPCLEQSSEPKVQ